MQVAELDQVIVHKLTNRPRCQKKLETERVKQHENLPAFDIPPSRIQVTKHQAEVTQYPGANG